MTIINKFTDPSGEGFLTFLGGQNPPDTAHHRVNPFSGLENLIDKKNAKSRNPAQNNLTINGNSLNEIQDKLKTLEEFEFKSDILDLCISYKNNTLHIISNKDLDLAGKLNVPNIHIESPTFVNLNAELYIQNKEKDSGAIVISANNISIEKPITANNIGISSSKKKDANDATINIKAAIVAREHIMLAAKDLNIEQKIDTQILNVKCTKFNHTKGTIICRAIPKSTNVETTKENVDKQNYKYDVKRQYRKKKKEKEDLSQKSIIIADEMVAGEFIGENLDIKVANKITICAKMAIDNLTINTHNLYLQANGLINGYNDLFIGADYIFNWGKIRAIKLKIEAKVLLNLIFAVIHGVDAINITTLFTFLFPFSLLRGTFVSVMSGIYLNLASLVSGFGFFTNSILHLNFGVSIPDIPRNFASMKLERKMIPILLIILKNIYSPIVTILKFALKLWSIILSGMKLKELYVKHPPIYSDDDYRSARLNTLNSILEFRSIFFSSTMLYGERDFIVKSTHFGKDNDNPFLNTKLPKFSQAAKNVLYTAPGIFMPAAHDQTVISAEYLFGKGCNKDFLFFAKGLEDISSIPKYLKLHSKSNDVEIPNNVKPADPLQNIPRYERERFIPQNRKAFI